MSKDIRSFFKPLTKPKSSTQEKDDIGIEKSVKPETKSSLKSQSKRKPPAKSPSKSSRSTSSSKPKNKSPKSEPKKKIDVKKTEVVSSDSESDIAPVKRSDKGQKNGSSSNKKDAEKIETVSSVSDIAPVKRSDKGQKNGSSNKKIDLDKIETVSSDTDVDVEIVNKNQKVTKHTSKNDVKPKNKSQEKILKTDTSKFVNLTKLTKKEVVSDDDDDTDIINPTPERTNVRKRKLQINSDSEEEETKIKKVTKPQTKEKLKPVSISDIFSGKVSQSKVKTAAQSQETVVKKTKKVKTELGVHGDEDFEKTLIDLDDDIFLQNEDILDKTIEGALHEHPEAKKGETKDGKSSEKLKPVPSDDMDTLKQDTATPKADKLPRKRPLDNENDDTPSKSKKTKLNHTDSGFDDQDRYEKKKYCAMQYQQYLNRGAPKNHGMKKLPKGKPDCLSNLTFLRTGVLDSLESEEFEGLIKEHGGKVVQSVTKKVNYVVVGEEPGPTKLQKAENYKIPTISEDELLDMILQKSGMPKKYTVTKKVPSFEDAGINDSFVSTENEEVAKDKSSDDELEEDSVQKKPQTKNQTENVKNVKKGKDENSVSKSDGDKSKQKEKAKVAEIQRNPPEKQEVDPCNISLSEKYKPKDLKQIIGQQMGNSNMNKLKKWLEGWQHNEVLRKNKKITQPKPWDKNHDGAFFKCALLSGPPGVGKTTTATLVAEALGFSIVEFNASDTRSKKLLQQEVATALNSRNISFFNTKSAGLDNKRVILMDEVDGMAGNEDRGGMQELISLIKTSKIPIICMCNDRNHQKMRTLSNYCYDLRFEKPRTQQILGHVMSICCKEGIKVSPQIVTEIINGTTCDIRQTLNQVSMLSNLDAEISFVQAQKESADSKKDTVLGPWQVCKMVFNEEDQKGMSLIDKSRLFFYDYSMGPLFVQENYLKVQPHVEKKLVMKHVAAAAEAISMGATVDKKIRESNNWSLLDLQAMYSSVLPGHYMSGHFTGAIDFPSWLGKNSRRNKLSRLITELSSHTTTQTSGGALAMNLDYSKALLTAIVTPLKKRGLEGVRDAVEVMKTYQLLREDLDSLVELCTRPGQKSLMDGVESKVKSAFTRLYNKEVPLFSYSANTGLSKKKTSALYDDEGNDDEMDEASETEDNIENDNLIKAKTKTKKETSKASTSKQSTSKQSTRGKGRGKK